MDIEGHVQLPVVFSDPLTQVYRVISFNVLTGSFTPSTIESTFSITRSNNVSGQLAPLVRMIVSGRFSGSQFVERSIRWAG